MALQPIPMWNLPRYQSPFTPPFVPGQGPGMPPSTPPMGANAPEWLQKVQGGLGKMFGMNQPNPYLSPQEQQAAQQQQRMAIAAQLLQNAGPRPKGTSGPLGGIGAAIQAGQGANQQFTADALRARLVAAQMANAGGKERSEPAQVRIARILSDPNESPEVKAEIRAQMEAAQSGGATEQQMEALRLQLLTMQADREQRQDREQAREQTTQRATQRNTIIRGIEQTGKIADLTRDLEGTFLEAGAPASDIRRATLSTIASLGGALGFDTTRQRQTLDSFDKLKKNTQDQLINLMSAGNLGEATNSKLAQYQSALANPETSPGAIMEIQANIAEILLEQADAEGYEIPNRAAVEERIKELHEYATPPAETVVDVPAAAASVSAITKMGVDQLRSLDLSQMSDEALEAARARWEALNAE